MILQRHTADKQSSFGELALMHNKPLQASDFLGILMTEFTNLPSLKLLRSVDPLSRLTILQLSHVAKNDETLQGLYVIQKGLVKITFGAELWESQNVSSLRSEITDNLETETEVSIEKEEGSYCGEWVLLGELKDSLSAVAVGEVVCVVLTKERARQSSFDISKESAKVTDTTALAKATLADLEWTTCVSSTGCSEVGLVHLNDKNTTLTCPLSSLLHSPIDESSARFITASLVSALEDIHKNGILKRT